MLFHFFSKRSSCKKSSNVSSARRVAFESLEERQMLSLTPVSPAPVDAPSDFAKSMTIMRAPTFAHMIVNASDDVLDHSDDFDANGNVNHLTLRDALDYVGKAFNGVKWENEQWNITKYEAFEPTSGTTNGYYVDHVYMRGVYNTIYIDDSIQTITLTSPLTIDKNVTIDGSGSSANPNRVLTIDGQGATSIINKTGGELPLKNITLANGLSAGDGGAINNQNGNLVVESVVFRQNKATNDGGAIAMASGTASVRDTIFDSNEATNDGGAIAVAGGTTTVCDSGFDNNAASRYGGAISIAEGTVEVFTEGFMSNGDVTHFGVNSAKLGGAVYNAGAFLVNNNGSGIGVSFYENVATGVVGTDNTLKYGSGGAIYNSSQRTNDDETGFAMIYNAYFTSNGADKYGGAISNYGRMIVQDGQFESNSAATGGAIQSAGDLTCQNSTFNSNAATARTDSYLNSGKTDFGGNGGAVYLSKNASNTNVASTAKFEGVTFNSNVASNAGGAIDCVSGGFTFASNSQNEFNRNRAGVIGGAIVYGSPFNVNTYASLNGVSCSFSRNASSYYAPTIAVSAEFSATDAQTLANFYGVQNSDVETFTRYKNSGSILSFEDLLVDMPAGTTSIVLSSNVKSATLTAGQSVDLTEFSVANAMTKIQYYATDAPDVKFNLYYTSIAGESLSLYAQRIILDETTNAVQYSFRIGGLNDCAVSQWRINWGDGTQTQVVDKLGFTLNANHLYANYGVYDVALSVTTLAGSVVDFGTVGKIFNEDPTAPFEGEEVVFASLDDELTDSLFNDLDWLDDAM